MIHPVPVVLDANTVHSSEPVDVDDRTHLCRIRVDGIPNELRYTGERAAAGYRLEVVSFDRDTDQLRHGLDTPAFVRVRGDIEPE
jgi:hypothetical protein